MWGQQVLAVNHPGATGSIASRIAANSPPDGYTLYMPVLSSFVALPGPAPNVPIRLPQAFTAIGFAAENPMFVVASPSLGISKISDPGSVKAITVASEEPLAEFPGLPTVAETIPGFSATGWQVLVAPVGTPEQIISKVSDDLRKVVTDPD